MLMTLPLGVAACATSATRSITCVLDTRPDSTTASPLSATWMSSRGNSCWSCCSSAGTGCCTTRSCWVRRSAPQMIRLIVPGALPSISTSRGCTTSASAMAGLVTAIRVMSKSVVSTVDRPVVRSTRDSTPGGSGACGVCGAWAASGDSQGVATTAASPSANVSARRNGFIDDLMTDCCFLISTDGLFHPLGSADGLDGVDPDAGRRRAGAGCTAAVAGRAARRTRRGAPAVPRRRGRSSARPSARRACRSASTSSGLRSASEILPSDAASAIRSASSGVTASVTTVVGCGSPLQPLFLVVARPGGQHQHVADRGPRHRLVVDAIPATLHGDDQVHARAGHDEPGHADHLVHLHRHRPHPWRDGGRQAGARLERRQLALGDGLVFDQPGDQAPVHHFFDLGRRRRAADCWSGQATIFRSLAASRVPVGSPLTATTTCRLATSTSRTGMRLTAA